MTVLKNTYQFLILSLFILSFGCNDYLDINDNPNNPTEAPLAGLMVNTTFETAQNQFRMGDITSYYVQYLASPNSASSIDVMDEVSHGNTWFNHYHVMTDLSDLMSQAEASGAKHYQGAAQILTALNLATTVDAWGDVPYSEALNFQTITPKYDNDEELYKTILNLLDWGINNLSQETDISIGDDDFIYKGDAGKWVKLGHMLKARYLNHLSATGSYDPNGILEALDNGFGDNADDAQVIYFEEEFNPWGQVAIDNDNLYLNGWISEQFVHSMDGTLYGAVDPRMPFMIGATDNGEYIGVKNGAGRGNAPESGARSTLTTDDFYSSKLSPMLIATYFEQKFIEAEAAYKIDKGRSYAAYLDGIRANMRKLNVAENDIEAYISSPSIGVGEGALTIANIFEEKWKAMFLQPESWVDARRFNYNYTDFEVPDNLNPTLNGNFLRRLKYPDSEVSRNGSNVPDVTLLDRVFWDQ